MNSVVDENNKMKFALISGCIIFGMSIFVAYIFFSILESSAEANLQHWKLGGAFAGFVFTASLLTSITFQVYKHLTTDSIAKFHEQIQELQSKLIRGAPCPQGYEIDVDEKHKLVFSRPEKWLPKGGLLYQYIGQDKIANFNVVYQSEKDLSDLYDRLNLPKFDSANVDIDAIYDTGSNTEAIKAGIVAASRGVVENESLTKEFILVDDLKSLKLIFSYEYSNQDKGIDKRRIRQSGVFTYVPKLKALYLFTFTDNEENYLKSSEVFNNVIRSIRFL
ncbi:MAG: hypothetical protein OIN85_09070 [Candidatus Methanoperedens sp.]|nr:hypothetical protein [Candidatus Methanoperedens sp.]